MQSFKVRYDDDLWKEIRSETSGDFRYSLKPLVLTESQFLAEDFRNAMVRVTSHLTIHMISQNYFADDNAGAVGVSKVTETHFI